MFDNKLNYHIFRDYDVVFDEKGNTCGTLRKVQWVKEGKEPDESKAKLEIRHLIVNEQGETFGKGYSFSTEEGPHELTLALIDNGFGDTKDIIKSISKRDNFVDAVKNIDVTVEDSDGEMFDMRDLLLGIDTEGDGDE